MGSGGGGNDNSITDYGRLYSSMPILEDGLSSGHASDTENNLAPPPPPPPISGISIVMDQQQQLPSDDPSALAIEQESGHPFISSIQMAAADQPAQLDSSDEVQEAIKDIKAALQKTKILPSTEGPSMLDAEQVGRTEVSPVWVPRLVELVGCTFVCRLISMVHRSFDKSRESLDSDQPAKLLSADEEEADTDLETDRLLGQQRLDDLGFSDEKVLISPFSSSSITFGTLICVFVLAPSYGPTELDGSGSGRQDPIDPVANGAADQQEPHGHSGRSGNADIGRIAREQRGHHQRVRQRWNNTARGRRGGHQATEADRFAGRQESHLEEC